MADEKVRYPKSSDTYKCLKDMCDGTHAEVVYMGGGQITVQLGDIQLGSIQILGANGVDLAAVDASGRFAISLPAGAATEASLAQAISALGNLVTSAAAASTSAKQDAGNTSLASIDGKVATAAKQDAQSTKLDTIAANVAALTKPADVQQVAGAVTVSNLPATQPISGSVAVSNLPATQQVSGSVSVSNFPGSQAVTGPLTDTQLRATAVPVSATSLPLPSGAATESGNLATAAAATASIATYGATAAKQDTGNSTLASILADLVLLLQTQGGTAIGVSGPMIQGVVNDAPPAQLDGTLGPLSLNSEGRLRVVLEQPVASFFTDSMFASCAWGASGF
jgi:hypothetical protein